MYQMGNRCINQLLFETNLTLSSGLFTTMYEVVCNPSTTFFENVSNHSVFQSLKDITKALDVSVNRMVCNFYKIAKMLWYRNIQEPNGRLLHARLYFTIILRFTLCINRLYNNLYSRIFVVNKLYIQSILQYKITYN